jgi:hypothetical protein
MDDTNASTDQLPHKTGRGGRSERPDLPKLAKYLLDVQVSTKVNANSRSASTATTPSRDAAGHLIRGWRSGFNGDFHRRQANSRCSRKPPPHLRDRARNGRGRLRPYSDPQAGGIRPASSFRLAKWFIIVAESRNKADSGTTHSRS